jgi:hypothetical protein
MFRAPLGFGGHGERLVAFDGSRNRRAAPSRERRGLFEPRRSGSSAVAQILGKLYFFGLSENLRRILLDYAQKRTGRANATFNAAC